MCNNMSIEKKQQHIISHESAVGSKRKMVMGNPIIFIRMFPVIKETCGGE